MSSHGALYDFFVNFDFDRYTLPYIPHNRLHYFPQPLVHFLGHRSAPTKEPPALVQWLSMLVATVGGLCLVSATFIYAPGLNIHKPPVIIASLGASAVLDYNTIRSPLSQPRNTVIGHTLSALIGVCIAKLFELNSDFHNIDWVSGAVGCACASLVMSLTGTIHPPGGATAVLASTEAQIVAMGWWFVPFVLIASLEMLGVALLVNNVFRQYPTYWWTGSECGHKLLGKKSEDEEKGEGEKEAANKSSTEEDEDNKDWESEKTLRRELSNQPGLVGVNEMRVSPEKIELPPHVHLTVEESTLLQQLQQRLKMPKTEV